MRIRVIDLAKVSQVISEMSKFWMPVFRIQGLYFLIFLSAYYVPSTLLGAG